MKNQTLQYYMHDGQTAFRFELAGDLNHEGARILDQAWRTASSVVGDRRLIVDMTFVTAVSEEGRALISRWHEEGAQLIANSPTSPALAESILGQPLPKPAANLNRNHTWIPFLGSSLGRIVTMLLLATIVFPVEAGATRDANYGRSDGRSVLISAAALSELAIASPAATQSTVR
jgi:hypothetical protein